MKNCKICGDKDAHELLEYCEVCAEALCIVAEGATFDQEARAEIAIDEKEAAYRLKLLFDKGWRYNGSI